MSGTFRRVFVVCARELRASAASPLIWIFLTAFLFMTGFCAFIVGNLLGSGQADLAPFFEWLGWMLLIFIPALGMPLWAEELRGGTFELLLSFPGRLWEMVLGKYLAGLAMLAVALALTFVAPLSTLYLGKPDAGSIVSCYLGAFLLGAEFLAASCLCSALSRSQTASFLLSLTLSTALMTLGWPVALETAAGWGAPDWLLSLVSAFGAAAHYQTFARGIVDFSDLAYFFATSFMFAFLASETLALAAAGASRGLLRRGMLADPAARTLFWGLLSSAVLAFAAALTTFVAASSLKLRFDLTSDKAYSLSPEAAKIAAGLEERVGIRFYFNPSRRMPEGLKRYGERVEWLLDEFAAASKGKVSITKLRPESDSEDEEAAVMDGMRPLPVNTGDKLFLGLAVSHGGRSCPLPFLEPQAERLLESEICRAALNVSRSERPLVGVMSALPVLGTKLPDGSVAQVQGAPLKMWQSFVAVQEDCELTEISLEAPKIPEKLDCLVIVQPSGISLRAQYAIDQYLLKGGKLAVFVDPRSFYAILKSQKEQQFADKVESDLPKLLPAWGVSYNKTILLADMVFAFRKSLPDKMVTNPMVLGVTREGINQDDPVTRSLSSLAFYFSGFLQVEPPEGVKKDSLVFSSTQSQAVSSFIAERVELAMRNFVPSGSKMDIAVRLSGSFPSAFPEGFEGDAAHLAKSQRKGQVLLFADSDMLFNDVCVRQGEDALGQRTIVRINDNITLLQNALDSLCGSEKLALVRARVPMSRPFERIEKIKAEAELAFRDSAVKLEKDLLDVQAKLNRQQSLKARDEQATLSDEQKEQLRELSAKSDEAKRAMKLLRRDLKAKLDSVELKFKLLNVALAPALVALAGLCWLLWPRRRKGGAR